MDSGIAVFVKRDDLLHPEVQGNKWRKLLPVLPFVKEHFPNGMVTFGGPFSNHLHAVAAAGRIWNIPTTGIVRGLYPDIENATLREVRKNGMVLHPVSKQEYGQWKHDKATWEARFPGCYVLPEGGATPEAVRSCAGIVHEIISQLKETAEYHAERPLYICTAAGTGCTAAGIVLGLSKTAGHALIFPVVNRGFEEETILSLLKNACPEMEKETTDWKGLFTLVRDYEFGGFAKRNQTLMDFATHFQENIGILPDPIYTSKMFFGVFDLLKRRFFPENSIVVMLHTGGLQGWGGFDAKRLT